jgi:hypothetical protein
MVIEITVRKVVPLAKGQKLTGKQKLPEYAVMYISNSVNCWKVS